jgi:hypothetical protein
LISKPFHHSRSIKLHSSPIPQQLPRNALTVSVVLNRRTFKTCQRSKSAFMRSDTLAAFRWWNTARNPLGPSDSIPVYLPPSEAVIVWNRFFPIFNLFAPPVLPQDRYWKAITDILSRCCQQEEVPSPETNFPEFIEVLYRLRMIVRPRSIANCVNLLTYFKCADFGPFLIYEAPLFCGDPLLFFRGLLFLIDNSHTLFDQFVAKPGLPDGFLHFYLSFLRPGEPFNSLGWRHHLLLGETFCRVLERSTCNLTCSPRLA